MTVFASSCISSFEVSVTMELIVAVCMGCGSGAANNARNGARASDSETTAITDNVLEEALHTEESDAHAGADQKNTSAPEELEKSVEANRTEMIPQDAQKTSGNASESSPASVANSEIQEVNSEILPELLKNEGYLSPATFKALVMEIVPDGKGSFTYYPMDYYGKE
jgi:restriction endonuclease Mrr